MIVATGSDLDPIQKPETLQPASSAEPVITFLDAPASKVADEPWAWMRGLVFVDLDRGTCRGECLSHREREETPGALGPAPDRFLSPLSGWAWKHADRDRWLVRRVGYDALEVEALLAAGVVERDHAYEQGDGNGYDHASAAIGEALAVRVPAFAGRLLELDQDMPQAQRILHVLAGEAEGRKDAADVLREVRAAIPLLIALDHACSGGHGDPPGDPNEDDPFGEEHPLEREDDQEELPRRRAPRAQTEVARRENALASILLRDQGALLGAPEERLGQEAGAHAGVEAIRRQTIESMIKRWLGLPETHVRHRLARQHLDAKEEGRRRLAVSLDPGQVSRASTGRGGSAPTALRR